MSLASQTSLQVGIINISFEMTSFTSSMLYETAYNIPFNWQKHLPPDIYRYHSLVWKETNAPVELHMGVVLPFVSACLGPRTKGHFLTRPTVLNLFWINVAASGVGKSITRHRFITDPLDYMIQKTAGSVPDFEISRFTRPGKDFLLHRQEIMNCHNTMLTNLQYETSARCTFQVLFIFLVHFRYLNFKFENEVFCRSLQ